MNNEFITLLANVALTLSFIIGLIFGIQQTRAAARDRRERLTLQTLREFQGREFVELLTFVSSRDLPNNWEGVLALPESDRVKLIQFAQEMESLGILVAEKYINLDLVDKTLGSFVVSSWEKYKPAFTDIRANQPDPFLGEYFQWLAEKIDRRMKENPRQPFHEAHRTS
jgi:hypothetical protein